MSFKDITPLEFACGKMNCPAIFKSEDGKTYRIRGKWKSDASVSGPENDDETTIEIPADILEGAVIRSLNGTDVDETFPQWIERQKKEGKW